MNINVSNGNIADNTMATMFPRLYMAINILKLIFVMIVLFVLYRLKTNETRNTNLNNLRYAQLRQQSIPPGQRSHQSIETAQGFSI